MMARRSVLLVLLVLTVTACGSATGLSPGPDDPVSDGGAAGACPVEEPDCVDTPQLGDDGDAFDLDEAAVESLRRDARTYLGWEESELNDLVRVARRGDEHFMLTEDYRVGRITVELDEVGGTFMVTKATVELPDGPETFELDG
jgi:hypothetical protein